MTLSEEDEQLAKRKSLGNLVRVVLANKQVRSQFEGVCSSTEDQMLLTQQNVNA